MDGYRVATVEEEPPFTFGPDDSSQFEIVWYVAEDTGEVHHGHLIDTVNDLFATVHLIPDPENGKLTPLAGSDWMPLDND